MAKKKKATTPRQQQLSPEKYIQTKARNLPVAECVILDKWEEVGITPILVARQHVSGNYTVGVYLIDTWCLGVKDSYFRFNMEKEEYEQMKNGAFKYDYVTISYNEAHNIIYGAIDFAEEIGIHPDKSFGITRFLLEEDTEDIPLIEYEYGKDGEPFLLANTELEADKYLSAIEKNGHFINYTVLSETKFYEIPEDMEADMEEVENWLLKQHQNSNLPSVEYNYIHPEYPQELHLVHPELQVLLSPKNNDFLSQEDTEMILSLPRETLVADLEHLIRYEIGRTYDKINELDWRDSYVATILHGLFFLGELRAEESLDTVLEVMRQDMDFSDFHFGDSGSDIFPLTLYYVGSNKLSELANYIKEPDLDCFFKHHVFEAVRLVAENHPERRGEVIDWCRDILLFFQAHIEDLRVFDAGLMGMFAIVLIELKAVELLPELKQLYATGLVDEMSAGDYDRVECRISAPDNYPSKYTLIDIYERYNEYKRIWGEK